MSCFANGCLDEDRETTKKEHTSTLERFDSQSDDEAGHDCHKHQGCRREPSIGEEHARSSLATSTLMLIVRSPRRDAELTRTLSRVMVEERQKGGDALGGQQTVAISNGWLISSPRQTAVHESAHGKTVTALSFAVTLAHQLPGGPRPITMRSSEWPKQPGLSGLAMAPKYHPTPLSGGYRKALTKEIAKSRVMTGILAERSHEKRRVGEALIREADNLACQSWNEKMWSDGGPAQPSPTIGQAINGGFMA